MKSRFILAYYFGNTLLIADDYLRFFLIPLIVFRFTGVTMFFFVPTVSSEGIYVNLVKIRMTYERIL